MIFTITYRALKAGSESPILVTIPGETFTNAWSVSLLGALHQLYVVSLQGAFIPQENSSYCHI